MTIIINGNMEGEIRKADIFLTNNHIVWFCHPPDPYAISGKTPNCGVTKVCVCVCVCVCVFPLGKVNATSDHPGSSLKS